MHDVQDEYLKKWQKSLDLIAQLFDVTAALIMRVHSTEIEVLLASDSEGNPYEPGEMAKLNTGLYCEMVMSERKQLLVPNALADEAWKNNPDVPLNMIAYLGEPLILPGGEVFGTICVLDSRPRNFPEKYQKLLMEFRGIVETDFVVNRKYQQEIHESENRFSEMFEHMGSGVAIYEPVDGGKDFVFKGLNLSAEKITNISRKEAIGKRLLSIFPQMKESVLFSALRRVLNTGESEYIPPFYYADNVRKGWRENRIYKLPSGEIVAIFDDVTKRIETKQKLQQAKERLELAADAARFGVWDYDLKTDHLIWDDWMFKLYGVNQIDFGGTYNDWAKLIHLEDIERVNRDIKLVLAGEKDFDNEFRVIFPSGEIRHNRSCAIVTRDGKGEAIRLTGISYDITDRKIAEEEKEKLQVELQHAQKMEAVGTLAGGIAHDFNNLLQIIAGSCELLLEKKEPTHDDYNFLQFVNQAADDASALVRKLLLFSRKIKPERKLIQLKGEVEKASKLLERVIPKMVSLDIEFEPELLFIMADPIQIEQMLLNLGTNAADAMPDGGKLSFKIQNTMLDSGSLGENNQVHHGKYVLLTVSDTGEGIDDKIVEKIFDPFFTTKDIGKGTGLGLASVYGIVESHDAYITCSSQVGVGTTFKIYFPVVGDLENDKREKEKKVDVTGGSETILIVDDESIIRAFVKETLVRYGYDVLEAASGEEAVALYSQNSSGIDLVLMDVGMPGMGGVHCFHELIQIDPNVNVLLASGYSVDTKIENCIQGGVRGFLAKPYKRDHLLQQVREILDNI